MHKLLITFCCFSLALLGEARKAAFLPKNSNGKGFNKNSQAVPTVISSTRVTNWGEWSEFESCNPNSFVVGFRQKVEPKHDGDNTALNAIELICNDDGNKRIKGATGNFGVWGDEKMCENKQGAIGFQLKQHKPQDNGDNTAANALRLVCEDKSTVSVNNDGEFGTWSDPIICPPDHVICGLAVQIQTRQDDGPDDTSLNNVDFKCCPFKKSSPVELSNQQSVIILDEASLNVTSRAVRGRIRSPQITNWGNWFDTISCQQGDFVVGFRQKVHNSLLGAPSDETSLNAIELVCGNGRRIFSAEMIWGVWGNTVICPGNQRAIGFQLKQEPFGFWDNTAANSFNLICQDNRILQTSNQGRWGDWSREIVCPRGSFICGISVQIESNQGDGDDTALNNVELTCCD